jgi:hypothetical protein
MPNSWTGHRPRRGGGTDHGCYQVFAINPLAVTRYRDCNVSAQLTGECTYS